MDPDRWRHIQDLFADALERPLVERDAFLSAACGDDAEALEEVRSLLAVSSSADEYFAGLDRGAAASDPLEELHRSIGDRYRLDDVVGRGGMGVVYGAQDLKHGRRVAIKTIDPARADGPALARFEREIRLTAALRHPHILPLLDSGVAGATVYYIMPFVQGESLHTRLDREGRLGPGHAISIAIEVAGALEHAHARGIVHRDIKPGNIMLGADHAVVVDFGIAAAAHDLGLDDVTDTGHAVGTVAYMAPERLAGWGGASSDIYALGAVLYEMLTGRRWIDQTAQGRPEWDGIPPGLRGVVARALSADARSRHGSAAELSEALRTWQADTPPEGVWHPAEPRRPGILERLLGRGGGPSSPPDRRSVAVLPFEDLNRDPEGEYFAEGITDDIIAQLSTIGELKVISRTSAMTYRRTDAAIPEIGRALHVSAILTGSVRRAGSRVRIVSQLVDVRTDEQMWSQTFDREMTHIFDIQSEVAQRIATALQARISDTEKSLIRRRPPRDAQTLDLYLRGRYHWNKRTRAGLEEAEARFREAAALDPEFAPAHAGVADVHLLLGSYGYSTQTEALAKARRANDRALALDDRLAEAHASRGQIIRADRDWGAEERAYRRAIELNPNYATAHQWYATLLAALGRREEALAHMDRALELDPLAPAISVTSGVVRTVCGDLEAGIEEVERTVGMAPRFFSAQAWVAELYAFAGRYEEAHRALRKAADLRRDLPDVVLGHALIHAAAGERDSALEYVERGRHFADLDLWLAAVYALLGDADASLPHLRACLSDPARPMFVLYRAMLFYLRGGPWWDPIRSDPRFQRLLVLMNMTDTGPRDVAETS
ncbi:MAG: protein kinase [Gemmatimonadota bacterium]|nr:protein kinase [Gemmatimonadota bacterium]